MTAYNAGFPNEKFELSGDAKWFDKSEFEVSDESEYAESDYHYSVKVGVYTEEGQSPKNIYCNVSGYFNGKDEPKIYSDDDGKAFFEYTMLDMPDGMLEQVFETVTPHLEQTRAEFEKQEKEHD